MYNSDKLFIFSVCAIIVLLPIVAVAGLWLFRRRSMRGFESAIAMDGATCLKDDDGSVVIRRRTFRNYFVLAILGLFQLGLVAILLSTIGDILGKTSNLTDAFVSLFIVVVSIVGIGAAMFTLVRSLRTPPVYINANTKMLEIGYGSSLRQTPFSSISRVVVEPSRSGFLWWRWEAAAIGVVLDHGDEVQLGTVSGNSQKMNERAAEIAQLISDATGAHWAKET